MLALCTRVGNGTAGRHILIAVALYLAARSPTERFTLQTADIARRLMRGGELHQGDAGCAMKRLDSLLSTSRKQPLYLPVTRGRPTSCERSVILLFPRKQPQLTLLVTAHLSPVELFTS
jgi:hypothetical protein